MTACLPSRRGTSPSGRASAVVDGECLSVNFLLKYIFQEFRGKLRHYRCRFWLDTRMRGTYTDQKVMEGNLQVLPVTEETSFESTS